MDQDKVFIGYAVENGRLRTDKPVFGSHKLRDRIKELAKLAKERDHESKQG